uniref:Uncharacterized protein n=1 Tax=Roseihalotalea indica TaxID=2867963 RepID=A0AA49JEC0_9BACT|nr:hypothetical protein K4G66_04145 [Tunicatimonas sp. TK19036]
MPSFSGDLSQTNHVGGSGCSIRAIGSGPTKSGKVGIFINDGTSDALLWKYEKAISRSFGSDTNTIINALMRKLPGNFLTQNNPLLICIVKQLNSSGSQSFIIH